MHVSMTPAALTRLISGEWKGFHKDGPFEESNKPDHLYVRFDSIKIQQDSDKFVVHYCWKGVPMVQAYATVNTGLFAGVQLNHLEGRIEVFMHGAMPGGSVEKR